MFFKKLVLNDKRESPWNATSSLYLKVHKVWSLSDVLQGKQHAPTILELTTQEQCCWRMRKGSVTLQCNSDLSLWECLTQHKISLVSHACYSQVVAPSDFLPFPKLKSIRNWISFQECRNYSKSNISTKQYSNPPKIEWEMFQQQPRQMESLCAARIKPTLSGKICLTLWCRMPYKDITNSVSKFRGILFTLTGYNTVFSKAVASMKVRVSLGTQNRPPPPPKPLQKPWCICHHIATA